MRRDESIGQCLIGCKAIAAKLVVAAIFVLPHIATAQAITAKLDRDKIVLGEQVTLELRLDGLNTNNAFITNWFNLPDTANHIQVIRKDTTDTIETGGLTSYLQHITITSFDSGRWAVRLPKLILQDKATGKQTSLKADSVFLQVLPVDVSALQDYHAIKDIIDVPGKPDYTLFIAGAISCIAMVILAALLLRRQKIPPPPINKPAVYLAPIDEAIRKINTLRKEGLPAKGQLKLFYTQLDDICRTYIYNRMQIRSMQSTSDELVLMLGVYLQHKEIKAKFTQVLRLADAVKFAKYLPGEQQHEEALQNAATSLNYIEMQIQIANKHVN